MAPLYDFDPHEKAVAPAAESVTRLLLERVRLVPQKWRSSVSVSSMGKPSASCRNDLVRARDAGPIPSDTMKTRLRFAGRDGLFDTCSLC